MWIRRPFEVCVIGGAVLLVPMRPARALPPPAAQKTSDEALSANRERFKLGMQRYEAGAFAEAIDYWEPIYRELGAERGYRLAYDLGVAYAEIGDTAAAAERLQAFVAGAELRRSRGETLAPIVVKEEADACARIAILAPPEMRTIPGDGDAAPPPATAELRRDESRTREDTAPPACASHERPVPPPPAETAGNERNASPQIAPRPVFSAPALHKDTVRPFSPAFLGAGGGLSVATALLAVPLANHAWTLRDRYSVEAPAIPASDRRAFEAARTAAYVTAGAAAALAVLTGGLTAWYFLGSTKGGVFVHSAASPLPGGASLDIHGQF